MTRWWRRGVGVLAVMLAVMTGLVAMGVAVNNLPRKPPDDEQLRRALNGAIGWLIAHRIQIEAEQNPALWWMVASASARMEDDGRLSPLIANFEARLREPSSVRSPWRTFFEGPDISPPHLENQVTALSGYQVLFLYGLTCQTRLAELIPVREELSVRYCPAIWTLTPHCATHQLMGLLWGLQNRCDNLSPALARDVADRVHRQLKWDFRVDDAYIQRVLMVTASHESMEDLKPVWLDRVVGAQLEDGGWDGDARLLPLGSSRYLTLGAQGFSIRRPISNFHTTAQATLLLAYLLYPQAAHAPNRANELASWYRLSAADGRRSN